MHVFALNGFSNIRFFASKTPDGLPELFIHLPVIRIWFRGSQLFSC